MIKKLLYLSLIVFNPSYSIQIFVKPYYDQCFGSAQDSIEIDVDTITCGEFTDRIAGLLGGGQVRAFRLALAPQAIRQDTEEVILYHDIDMPTQIYFNFKDPELLLKESMFGGVIFDKGIERCVLSVIFEDTPLMGMDDERKAELRLRQLIKLILQETRARSRRLGIQGGRPDNAESIQIVVEFNGLARFYGYSRALAWVEQLLRERGFDMLKLDDDLAYKLANQFYLEY